MTVRTVTLSTGSTSVTLDAVTASQLVDESGDALTDDDGNVLTLVEPEA